MVLVCPSRSTLQSPASCFVAQESDLYQLCYLDSLANGKHQNEIEEQRRKRFFSLLDHSLAMAIYSSRPGVLSSKSDLPPLPGITS